MARLSDLSTEQLLAYADVVLYRNNNYFITGKAGTGKSFLLSAIAFEMKMNCAVVAPTGIAAINVGGQTIHSFFGLDTAVQQTSDNESVYRGLTEERIEILQSLDVLIIDEISMVRVDTMDMIDKKLRIAKRNPVPFGGCQIIAFGDLYQLPPVIGKDKTVLEYLESKYNTVYFFGAPGCIEKPFKLIELSKIIRQTDKQFIKMLNEIRIGNYTEETLKNLNLRVVPKVPNKDVVVLTPTNFASKRINDFRLQALKTPIKEYTGVLNGSFGEEDLPTDKVLSLKVGAQVVILKNDSENRWVNGTIATISDLRDDEIEISIGKNNYKITQSKWVKYAYHYDKELGKLTQSEIGNFVQYPIKLAYAMTIHKSQGQTYDSVVIDYSSSRAFAEGQTYVALSRCRSLNKLYLTTPITRRDISVNRSIVQYLENNPPVWP